MEDVRYPICQFEFGKQYTPADTEAHIKVLSQLPSEIKQILTDARDSDLEKSYRTDGWTIRQLVHHLADSHSNALIRFKLALTEDNPVIKPYEEDLWAKLSDYELPYTVSLQLLEAIHIRWVRLIRSLSEEDFMKTFFHPAMQISIALRESTAHYTWHSRHHLEHIKIALKN